MADTDRKIINKIIAYCEQIITFKSAFNSAVEFTQNTMALNATAFNIMQIGEMTVHLSEDTKTKLNNIPWSQIKGMRNRIVHGYDYIKMEVLWETISEDIPKLLEELKKVDI